jgi:broad specificity phosphatase PhoE
MGEAIANLYVNNEQFQGRRIRIYTSLHVRIKQTSEAISKVLPSSIVLGQYIDEDLRQRNYGVFDGLCRKAKKELDPVVYAKLHSTDLYERYVTEIPGGESCLQLEKRLRRFLRRLKNQVCEFEDILIVNHGPQCRILETILAHSDPVLASQSDKFGTGDIVMVKTDMINPGVANVLLTGKQRSKSVEKKC